MPYHVTLSCDPYHPAWCKKKKIYEEYQEAKTTTNTPSIQKARNLGFGKFSFSLLSVPFSPSFVIFLFTLFFDNSENGQKTV